MKINELKNDHKNARKRTDRSSALIKESFFSKDFIKKINFYLGLLSPLAL